MELFLYDNPTRGEENLSGKVLYIGPLFPTSGVSQYLIFKKKTKKPITSTNQKPIAAMKIPSNSHLHMLSYLIVLLLLPLLSLSADPDSLQDFCVADLSASLSVNGFPCKPASKVTSDDFFFDGLSKVGDTSNIFGSNVTGGNVLTFPALNTLGISMNRVDFAPGGLNSPHIHPRATESGVVIEGELLVGFVTTGNVYHSKVLTAGQMFVIPKGLVHFQKNVGVGKALAITAFNSQFAGAVVLPSTLFASTPSIPDDVLTRAFQVDEKVVESIKSKLSS